MGKSVLRLQEVLGDGWVCLLDSLGAVIATGRESVDESPYQGSTELTLS